MKKATTIGGQALIEGIMMKGPDKTALCVRLPGGDIDTSYMNERRLKDRYKILGLPVIRGSVAFVESMISGYKALMISAEKSGYAELEEEKDKDSKSSKRLLDAIMIIAAVLGILLAVVLFTWLPAYLFNLINRAAGHSITPLRTLFEGIIKMIVFIGYIAAVSRMKDIKRIFMYHGAEHKAIFCYENGEELTVENVRKNRRFHPRCGTSFMILMLIVGIIVSGSISHFFPSVAGQLYIWVPVRLLLIPLICGIGYELIRICGRYDNILTRIIAAPGLWLQRITTKEPDDGMIEVAITALMAVIPEDPNADRW
ncbi:MAG TPA: DUF1385 domain-containing protein [Clostridiales bacterium]|nr:DUF1385 domain-containing protein [Clostridiales bacterium]